VIRLIPAYSLNPRTRNKILVGNLTGYLNERYFEIRLLYKDPY